jgi:hypothetical protein
MRINLHLFTSVDVGEWLAIYEQTKVAGCVIKPGVLLRIKEADPGIGLISFTARMRSRGTGVASLVAIDSAADQTRAASTTPGKIILFIPLPLFFSGRMPYYASGSSIK